MLLLLVLRLNVLEDCAMMNVLFSDKTGTLTQNKLSVQGVKVTRANTTEMDVLLAGALCSRLENSDPIDMAVLAAFDEEVKKSNSVTLLPKRRLQDYQPLRFVPFDASNRRTEVRATGADQAPP